jgi:type I restriction enzyme M protein
MKSREPSAKRLATPQSVNAAVKSICDIMRRSNCAGALQYVPELTWILFLRILDERERIEIEEADAVGETFTPTLADPYRWQDWADPEGVKRRELTEGAAGGFFRFVNDERSEERRVGKECRRLCRSRWSPYH